MDNALGALRRALAIRETADTQALFVQTVRGLQSPPDVDDFRALFWRALSEPWGRVNTLAPVAAKLVKQSAAIGDCIKRAVAAWPRRLPAEELFGPSGLAAVAADRILRSLMETATIADLDFERFLTSARFAMLQIASAADASSPVDPKALDFACALARQCFVNEHVFALTDDEAAAAQQLRDKVVAALASGADYPRALARRGRDLLSAARAPGRRSASGQDLVRGAFQRADTTDTRAGHGTANCAPRFRR